MFEELNKRREAVAANIAKSFENDIEKARSGIYEDTPENRRLNRVGQQYGSKKKEEEPAGKSKSKGESGSYEHYAKQSSDSATKSLQDHAAVTDSKKLMRAANDEHADPKLREAANKELVKRGEQTNAENKKKEKSKPKNGKKPKRQNPTSLIELGKDKAKKENKPVIAGIDEDGQQFFDDARNYAAGTDLDRVLYTIYPDGAYDAGFVEQKSALETLLDEDPTAYEKIAYSGLSNEDWLKKVSKGEDKILADAAKERLQDLKKVKDVMTAFDDITMDDDEFDVLVDSIVGKSGAALKLRKTILSKDFNDDNDKRKAYESAIEQLVWMMKS